MSDKSFSICSDESESDSSSEVKNESESSPEVKSETEDSIKKESYSLKHNSVKYFHSLASKAIIASRSTLSISDLQIKSFRKFAIAKEIHHPFTLIPFIRKDSINSRNSTSCKKSSNTFPDVKNYFSTSKFNYQSYSNYSSFKSPRFKKESDKSFSVINKHAFNKELISAGASISHFDWAPSFHCGTHIKEPQILSEYLDSWIALSTYPNPDSMPCIDAPSSEKSIIEIWNVGRLRLTHSDSRLDPKIHCIILFEHGAIFGLKWLPLHVLHASLNKDEDDRKSFYSETHLKICEKFLGHLIILSSDGFVRILPVPLDLSDAPKITNEFPNIIVIRPNSSVYMTLNINLNYHPVHLGAPISMSISDSFPDRLAVGYSSGHIAYFQLSHLNPLYYDCSFNHLYPNIIRPLSLQPIIDLCFHPLNPSLLAFIILYDQEINIFNLEDSTFSSTASCEMSWTQVKTGLGGHLMWSKYQPEYLTAVRSEPNSSPKVDFFVASYMILNSSYLKYDFLHKNCAITSITESPSICISAISDSRGIVKVCPLYMQAKNAHVLKRRPKPNEMPVSWLHLAKINENDDIDACRICNLKVDESKNSQYFTCWHQSHGDGAGFIFCEMEKDTNLDDGLNGRYCGPTQILFNPSVICSTWLGIAYPNGLLQFKCLDHFYQPKMDEILGLTPSELPQWAVINPKCNSPMARFYRMLYYGRNQNLVISAFENSDKKIKHQEIYQKWLLTNSARGRPPKWVKRFRDRLKGKELSSTDSESERPPDISNVGPKYKPLPPKPKPIQLPIVLTSSRRKVSSYQKFFEHDSNEEEHDASYKTSKESFTKIGRRKEKSSSSTEPLRCDQNKSTDDFSPKPNDESNVKSPQKAKSRKISNKKIVDKSPKITCMSETSYESFDNDECRNSSNLRKRPRNSCKLALNGSHESFIENEKSGKTLSLLNPKSERKKKSNELAENNGSEVAPRNCSKLQKRTSLPTNYNSFHSGLKQKDKVSKKLNSSLTLKNEHSIRNVRSSRLLSPKLLEADSSSS